MPYAYPHARRAPHRVEAGIGTNTDSIQDGISANDEFGHSAASAGDLDGDGSPDLVIGSDGYASSTGRIDIYCGP